MFKSFTEPTDYVCSVKVCDKDSSAYKTGSFENLCKDVEEKSLPTYSELYIANKYGSIIRRLTNDDVYDGEARVSPNGKFVVFTKYDTEKSDYNLFKLSLEDMSDEIRKPVRVSLMKERPLS